MKIKNDPVAERAEKRLDPSYAIDVVNKVAREHPELKIGEYMKIYDPGAQGNECCFKCWKAVHNGCSWARRYELPDGAIAEMVQQKSTVASYKIFYCPEYQSDKDCPEEIKNKPWDEDGMYLLRDAIAHEVADDYRRTLIDLKRQRIIYMNAVKNGVGKKKLDEILMKIYASLSHKKHIEEEVFPDMYQALMRQMHYQNSPHIDALAVEVATSKRKPVKEA